MAGQGIDHIQGPVTCVHIITRMDKGGSAENTFLTLRHLNRHRFNPVLMIGPTTESEMSPKERNAKYRDLQGLVEDGITVKVCPYLYRKISLFYDLMAFIWIWRWVRKLGPEIVHTHTSKAGILGRWAAFMNHVPIICHTPHGHIFYGYFGPVKKTLFMWLERLTSHITHRIICLTQGEKADSLRFKIAQENKLFVCPSGVDLDWIKKGVNHRQSTEWQKKLQVNPDDLIIGTMGRHVKIKGHDIFLTACRKVLEEKPNTLFCFLGSGPLEENLISMAESWHIAHRVRFIPWQTDTRPILDLFDIFVFPSLNEGMGRALVEAMVMKKPVIATQISGIPDLVHEGVNGVLVPPSDSSALAEAIIRLADHPDQMKEMGRISEKIAERYSLHAMIQKVEGLYKVLLNSHAIKSRHLSSYPGK